MQSDLINATPDTDMGGASAQGTSGLLPDTLVGDKRTRDMRSSQNKQTPGSDQSSKASNSKAASARKL